MSKQMKNVHTLELQTFYNCVHKGAMETPHNLFEQVCLTMNRLWSSIHVQCSTVQLQIFVAQKFRGMLQIA